MPTDPTPQLTGEDAELVARLRQYLTDWGGSIPPVDELVDQAATRLASLSAELEGARSAMADLDAALADCPIEHPALQRFKYPKRHPEDERCPKCGATSSQNCGPQVTAAFKLSEAVRPRLSPNPAPAGRGEP